MRRPGHCLKCGIYREGLHRDHIVPKFLGGADSPENIQLTMTWRLTQSLMILTPEANREEVRAIASRAVAEIQARLATWPNETLSVDPGKES